MSSIILPGTIDFDAPFRPGTEKPEEEYELFSKLGARLGLPCPQAFVTLEARSPDGELLDRNHQRSRTLNRNYWNFLFAEMAAQFGSATGNTSSVFTSGAVWSATFGAGALTVKTIAAASLAPADTRLSAGQASAGSTATGIVVGTGTTAESFEGSALATICANGTAANQFSYAAQSAQAPTYNSGTKTWTILHTRVLNNNGTGSIVVTETGMYGGYNASGQVSIMTSRDLLASSSTVLAGGQLTVTYTFTLTFPA